MFMPPSILLCTVGTSLFRPNLEGLKSALTTGTIALERRALAEAYAQQNWTAVAHHLTSIDAHARLCGAEINSIASLLQHEHVTQGCGLFFLHSDTPDGLAIATILQQYYRAKGHELVETVNVTDLQDQDPKRFRTKGLRQLAREVCKILRERSPAACAINATGGYKAQIAIAVLIGQAVGVPVYYKHELFDEIIAFPPMPVALDFELWMRASGMLFDLVRNLEPAPYSLYADEWSETYESLVERVSIDHQDYIELSPTGQIFHDTFHERFRSHRDQVLPPPVPTGQKRPPRLEDSGHMRAHPEIQSFMEDVTAANPWVSHCATFYYNPDLSQRTRFHQSAHGIEGILSNSTYTVKFRVETSAQTPGQQTAVVATLNEWLDSRQ
jgi:putative CRISPR-associated protein (TIGR02619 family)